MNSKQLKLLINLFFLNRTKIKKVMLRLYIAETFHAKCTKSSQVEFPDWAQILHKVSLPQKKSIPKFSALNSHPSAQGTHIWF